MPPYNDEHLRYQTPHLTGGFQHLLKLKGMQAADADQPGP